MLKARLQREETSDLGTFGRLTVQGLSLVSGELPERGNARSISCIPAGTYQVSLHNSPTFGPGIYRLASVPGRTDVLMHPANWMGDRAKGHLCQLEGCIALGLAVAPIQDKATGKTQRGVTSSKAAFRLLMDLTKGQPFTLTILDPAQAEPQRLAA